MNRLTLNVIIFALMLLLAFPAGATETVAKQAIIIDTTTGAVLLSKDVHKKMPTSSMSKVMTIYMVFDALKQGRISLDDEVLVSEKAWRKGGSKMFIEVGKKVKVEDLIQGVIVQSGNDAAIALGEALGGTEEVFAASMNDKARLLGMTSSHFANASGWPQPDHYSTARDLAILAWRTITDFPEFYHYYSEKEFTYNNIHQTNRNPLLFKNMGVDGIKTGHTEVGGYGLMASAERNGRRLVMVVNGMKDEAERAQESARLLEWAFSNFENARLFEKGEEVETVKVWLGQPAEIPLVIDEEVLVTIPVSQKKDLKVSVQYDVPLKAPVSQGDEIGTLVVEVPGMPVQSWPLLAGKASAELGLVNQIMAKGRYFVLGEK